MLAQARNKAAIMGLDIRFEIGDAENLPFKECCFDAVFARHVLWTLPNPEKTLGEWKRVLKCGGRTIIIDGVWCDGSLNSRFLRFTGHFCRTVLKKKGSWSEINSRDIWSALPNAGGTPLEAAEDYLRLAGFINLQRSNLLTSYINNENLPIFDRIRRNYSYYLISGDKR